MWPVIRDMRALLTWINQNATEQYRRINPNGFLFARPSDGLFPHFADVFPKSYWMICVSEIDPVTGCTAAALLMPPLLRHAELATWRVAVRPVKKYG